MPRAAAPWCLVLTGLVAAAAPSGCFDGGGVAPCATSCSPAQPCAAGLTCQAGRCAEPGQLCDTAAPVLHLDLVGPGTVTLGSSEVLCDASAGDTSCEVPWDGVGAEVLDATGAAGAEFAGWSGACVGTGSCMLERGVSYRVGASFGAGRRTISITVTGGEGVEQVVSAPPGLSCPGTCEATFLPAESVVLTAFTSPLERWRTDASWTGACTSADPDQCVVPAGASAAAIGYTFVRTPLVTLQVMGGDDYSIVGELGTCTRAAPCAPVRLDAGARVELTAQVTDSGQVTGWQCEGTICQQTGLRNETVTTSLGVDDVTISASVGPGFAMTLITGSNTSVTSPPTLAAPPMSNRRASFFGALTVTGTTTPCDPTDLGMAGCTMGGCQGSNFTCMVDMDRPRQLNFR